MKTRLINCNLILSILILTSMFISSISILSFSYPLTTTLDNHNILVVEKNGIFICDQNYTNILETLYTFSEEDKIKNETSLSKTILKKSSLGIFILTNNKLYIIDKKEGYLFYPTKNEDNQLIKNDNPDYVSVAYSYNSASQTIKFFIGYINQLNYLYIQYYNFSKYSDSGYYINLLNTSNINSVTRSSKIYQFQNKGLSCDKVADSSRQYSWLTCFLIAKTNDEEYLIPVYFKIDTSTITFISNIVDTENSIKINEVSQIRTETNGPLTICYVCYSSTNNEGYCKSFYINKTTSKSYFNDLYKFDMNCRPNNYGIKVNYIFETKEIIASCSNIDGSFQAYSITNNKVYNKFIGCTSIYGYSIVYLNYTKNLYVTSDVRCPNGKIPYTLLINENDEEYLIEYAKSTIIESPTSYKIEDNPYSTIILDEIKLGTTNVIDETKEYSTNIINEIKGDSTSIIDEMSENSSILTEKIEENSIKWTEKISEILTENIENVNHCPEMCSECNSEKKCTKCNREKDYYPIEISLLSDTFQTLICINETIKDREYPELYLDKEDIGNESFKLCYEKCASCYGKSDAKNQNCKTCASGYILHPEIENSTECVAKPNPYYYIQNGIYTTTNLDRCPNDFNYLIKKKNKCIENCELDSKYKYTYDDICYEECPENTYNNTESFKCKDFPHKCIYTEKRLYTLSEKITNNEIETLTSKYAKEYNYTNNHISLYENNIYIITIYKNGNCLTELGLSNKIIDFGACYDKVKNKIIEDNDINNNINLIIVNIKTKPGKEEFVIKPEYGLYNPFNGSIINLEDECKDDKVTVQNNFSNEFNNSKVSSDIISKMAEEGIDLFDPYNSFYNDLCTHYPSTLGKDIPLKKRILAYYPDIDLCDDNCNLLGVFLNNKTARCECSLIDVGNKKESYKDNALYQNQIGEYEEFFYLTNINVIKCYKGVFEYKYFIKSFGGFIILGLIIMDIFCTIVYCWKSKLYIRNYIFTITNRYLEVLSEKNTENLNELKNISDNMNKISFPPRKGKKTSNKIKKPNNKSLKSLVNSSLISNDNQGQKPDNIILYSNNSKEKLNKNPRYRSKSLKAGRTNIKIDNDRNNLKNKSYEQKFHENLLVNIEDVINLDMDDFLNTDPDDMDYDDALRRDNRTFCRFYYHKIQSEQMLINIFCYKEYLKPIPIKLILFVLQVDLYFFINALFYNEEYVDKKFELENDTFIGKLWRFLDNLFYAFIVGVIINYIIEFFFIQEKKLRDTLKREKGDLLILKDEILNIIKDLEKRYSYFIAISFIILCFTWYYISCFNHIYPNMQEEWLIFSVFIIICIQLLSLLTSLLETIFRFLSFRFKSEKLFKLSLLFS